MLEEELKKGLKGEVRFDAGVRALYATDASNYRQVPIGVVLPKDEADIENTLRIARQHNAPILSRGAGTSLAGQCCNVAVVMDFSKYLNHILAIDPGARTAVVEPGVILDHLRQQTEKYGLTFGPDPASHSRCTLGGMIGNNSCGVHAIAWGKTVDNVESLEILTYDGLKLDVGRTPDAELDEIIRQGGRRGALYASLRAIRDQYAGLIRSRFPKIPRRVSGYNLDELLPENGFHVARALVGTEGTCVTTLKAKLRLVESPRARVLLVLGYPTVYDAAQAVPQLLEYKPIGLEGFDFEMVDGLRRYQGYDDKIKKLPKGQAWLLLEFGGQTPDEAQEKTRPLVNAATGAISALLCDTATASAIWSIRESALAATAFIPGARDRYEGWEDASVPPARLASYLRELRALYILYGYRGAFYGHFGDGCVHTRIDFDLDTPKGMQDYRRFLDDATDLVVGHGGSISGEHGDGQARAELLPRMFGPELMSAFRQFKDAWDPSNRMNPGKIIQPRKVLEDLRYGIAFQPKKVETHFKFPDDQGSFARAAQRCVGVGQCRREEGGLMCPSYQVTREEEHSTRGRAHLLFEMLKGETITDGWRSAEVKEALDLCLACKGCKSDCPTNVDMATYKAEFLSHYYRGRLRPRQAYVFGWVHRWARLGSLAPGLINTFTRNSAAGGILKRLAGVSPGRKIPTFSDDTFQSWFHNHKRKLPLSVSADKLKRQDLSSPVLLWADTFNNFFSPGIAQAAVEVLESLGHPVVVPKASLCCGRPLYDYGMLPLAKKLLKRILSTLKQEIESGMPIIVLEPSCAAVFRDELVNLFPEDPLAQKLSRQTFLLSEYLTQHPHHFPRLARKALVQAHCHHRAVMGFESEKDLLEKLGLEVSLPEPGCCGMAGSFGFEKEHADLSLQIAERTLLPAVRQAPQDTLILADGFSCRGQILQGTGRRAMHLAELLRLAIHSQA